MFLVFLCVVWTWNWQVSFKRLNWIWKLDFFSLFLVCRFANMLTFVVILSAAVGNANSALVGLGVRSEASFLVTASCYTLAWTDYIPWWSKIINSGLWAEGLSAYLEYTWSCTVDHRSRGCRHRPTNRGYWHWPHDFADPSSSIGTERDLSDEFWAPWMNFPSRADTWKCAYRLHCFDRGAYYRSEVVVFNPRFDCSYTW